MCVCVCVCVCAHVCMSFEPFVLWQQPTPFSRLYLSTRLCLCMWLPSQCIVCLPCSESTSQETLQFTYHIQTAFVLNICHFHSLISHSPLMSVFLYLVPFWVTSTKSGFIFVHFNHLLAIAEWGLFPLQKLHQWLFIHMLKTNVTFFWWVTSCGQEIK